MMYFNNPQARLHKDSTRQGRSANCDAVYRHLRAVRLNPQRECTDPCSRLFEHLPPALELPFADTLRLPKEEREVLRRVPVSPGHKLCSPEVCRDLRVLLQLPGLQDCQSGLFPLLPFGRPDTNLIMARGVRSIARGRRRGFLPLRHGAETDSRAERKPDARQSK
jgi:hypothetical protein